MAWMVTCFDRRCFCFFKQKTAYEMSVSDWSSDVCSSDLVDEEVPSADHGALGCVLAGMPAPYQHLVDHGAAFTGCSHRLVGLGLMVDQFAVTVVAVYRHQDVASRVGDPVSARRTAESAEHLGVNDAEPGAGEHGD